MSLLSCAIQGLVAAVALEAFWWSLFYRFNSDERISSVAVFLIKSVKLVRNFALTAGLTYLVLYVVFKVVEQSGIVLADGSLRVIALWLLETHDVAKTFTSLLLVGMLLGVITLVWKQWQSCRNLGPGALLSILQNEWAKRGSTVTNVMKWASRAAMSSFCLTLIVADGDKLARHIDEIAVGQERLATAENAAALGFRHFANKSTPPERDTQDGRQPDSKTGYDLDEEYEGFLDDVTNSFIAGIIIGLSEEPYPRRDNESEKSDALRVIVRHEVLKSLPHAKDVSFASWANNASDADMARKSNNAASWYRWISDVRPRVLPVGHHFKEKLTSALQQQGEENRNKTIGNWNKKQRGTTSPTFPKDQAILDNPVGAFVAALFNQTGDYLLGEMANRSSIYFSKAFLDDLIGLVLPALDSTTMHAIKMIVDSPKMPISREAFIRRVTNLTKRWPTMSFAGQKALDRLRQIVGTRLNTNSFEDLRLTGLRYSKTIEGLKTYDDFFPYNENSKTYKLARVARSFNRADRHASVGGVVIGRIPDKQHPGPVLTDIKWRQMSKGVRFTLYTDSTTPTTLDPVENAIVATALAYAADGRVIAVTILHDRNENGQDQTIYLHPALKDTRIGQHMIAIDKWIFESMKSTTEVKKQGN